MGRRPFARSPSRSAGSGRLESDRDVGDRTVLLSAVGAAAEGAEHGGRALLLGGRLGVSIEQTKSATDGRADDERPIVDSWIHTTMRGELKKGIESCRSATASNSRLDGGIH